MGRKRGLHREGSRYNMISFRVSDAEKEDALEKIPKGMNLSEYARIKFFEAINVKMEEMK